MRTGHSASLPIYTMAGATKLGLRGQQANPERTARHGSRLVSLYTPTTQLYGWVPYEW
jgi:hypothetical protein